MIISVYRRSDRLRITFALRRATARASVFAVGAALAGCAASSGRPPTGPAPFVVTETVRAASPTPSAIEHTHWPGAGQARVFRYRIIEGDDAGRVLIRQVRPDSGPARWRITDTLGNEPKPIEERIVSLADDGALILEEHRDYSHGVIVEFTPKLVHLPSELAPGEPFRQVMQLRLPLISKPNRLREKGVSRREVTLVGESELLLEGKPVRALHVRETIENDLGAARSTRMTDRWYSEDEGLIAERYEEAVKALGLISTRTTRAMTIERDS